MGVPVSGRKSLSIGAILIALLLWMPVAASAASSVYCSALSATVANGGSVDIDVSTCDGPFDGGMSGPIAPFAQHGTVTIGANSGGTQFVTYAHSGDSATTDQFFLEDNDLGVVTVNITIDPPASPITVSPGALATMTAGTAFSQALSASGGTAPYTYSLQSGSLPVGIALTSGGVLNGTPTQRGGYAFTVRVTDNIGQFVDKGYTGTVQNPTISISPTSATAIQGISFSQTISASGGVGPYTFSLENGALPTGISLSSSGLLSGTTSSATGSYPLVLRVTDSSTGPGVYFELENFTLTVAAAPSVSISVSPSAVNEDGATTMVYTITRSQNLATTTIVNLGYSGSADSSDYVGGTLTITIPPGSTSGIVVINPVSDTTVEPDETLTITVLPGSGYGVGAPSTATGTILNDDAAPPSISSISPNSGPDSGGTPVVITGTNLTGATAVTFGGTAAASFTVDSSTTISAVTPPGTAGAVDVTVTTPDGTDTETGGFTYNPPAIPTLSINNVHFSEANSGTTTIPFTISLSSPAGPGGVTFDIATADGTATAGEDYEANSIVGASISAGQSTYVFNVDVYGDTTYEPNETFFVNITNLAGAVAGDLQGQGTIANDDPVPDITLAPASLSAATVGVFYSETMTASGGTSPYNYTVSAGALPAGMSLSSAGVLAGTPSMGGTFNFTVTATDSSTGSGPHSGSRAYSFQINAGVPSIVSSVSVPANGYYRAGDVLFFTVNFDEAVFVNTTGGSPSVSVVIGATTVDASYVSGSGSSALVFQYLVNPGQLDLNGIQVGSVIGLNGGAIANGSGIPADLTLNGIGSTSGVFIDAAAPTVTSSAVDGSPNSDALAVDFLVTFSKPVIGVDASDFVLTTTGSIAGSITGVATPDNVTYTVSVTGISGIGSLRLDVLADGSITDTPGNPMITAYSSGTPWMRSGSSNASLAGLVSSTGALNPAFDAATLGYTITVANSVASLTLTPTADDPHAMITVNGAAVASGSTSQSLALAVGTTAIPVVVTAQDGTTLRTYIVTVVRAASTNALLTGLSPSLGKLDPVFDATTFGYAVAVANSVASLTLTPTADDPNTTITVNGVAVASGSASQPLALAIGTTEIPVVVTAQDGATRQTYTVKVNRALPAPTVLSRTIEINAGQTASVELSEGATGGPFTGAGIVDISDRGAGSAHIEQKGQNFLLVFASSSTFSGGADIRFTLSNAYGNSAPGTISFVVLARPDPSKDAEVIGLLKAQVDTAKRFAQVQTRNFNGRLEQLHDEGDRRRNSMSVRLGYNQNVASDNDRAVRALNETGANIPGLLSYAPQSSGGAAGTGFAAGKANGSGAPDSGDTHLGSYAIWTGGFVDFSESDTGGIDLDSTLVGVSGGVDYRFSDKFISGFGIGFGRDRTDVGANGTENTGRAYSAALYGSYKPANRFFIDGLVGASWLDFDSNRYITTTGDFATGSRSGQQVFGSLSASYELRNERWLVSPYGRVELSRTWLDGFIEDGGGAFGLRYGNQDIDTISGIVGLRAAYAFKTGWGTLTPGGRIEYTHDFAGSSRIDLGYVDLANLPYWLDIETSRRDHLTLGMSLDAELDLDWTVRFDYRTAFGNDNRDHGFGLKIGKTF
ncbi:autotransporter domain-containing protein [Brucella anthropi]|uniref:autotransporter domain-containing protein n=1 Tax=Brucella anthropi TaxID=529 RepID=UPI002362545B|nr:autotransporter domain-containing protein [Brucella anthropi]